MDRDEYLLFSKPLHELPAYVRAHQLAGGLELVPADKPQKQSERDAVLERLAREPTKR